MTLDLSAITLYELVSFTQRRIDAFASLLRSRDESLTKKQRDDESKEICRYPRSDSGADYRTLRALQATGRVGNHVLIAQHVLAVLSVNSPSMRTTVLRCERLWAQVRGEDPSVVALYRSLWHRYRAIDVYNAPEEWLVTMADGLDGNWQTMTATLRTKITYGLCQQDCDGVAVESSVGAPLHCLAYLVQHGYDMCRTLETLQKAVSCAFVMACEDPDELGERELICDELGCWVVELPAEASTEAPLMAVMFPSIVVAGDDWALPTLAELHEMLDEDEKDQLWAVPLDGVAWDFYRDKQQEHYSFNGRTLVVERPRATLSLRPSHEQWRRFVNVHERAQAASYVAPTLCAPLRAPTASARPVICARTYTIFRDGECVYVRHFDAPDVVVDGRGRVLEA